MKFNLNFTPIPSVNKLNYTNNIMFLGSCFSQNIGGKLTEHKFNTSINPFGNIFNPINIAEFLNNVIEKKEFTDADVFEKESKWYCYQAHSLLTFTQKNDLLNCLNTVINEWHLKLKQTHYLFLTFGTAYYYTLNNNNLIVANCHKLPANLFTKSIVDVNTTINIYNNLFTKLLKFNSNIKVVITVSPVKHLKDGVAENVLSKSTLIYLTHQLINKNKQCSYFPSFEIVTEDLRDYRFYKEDLAHPNEQAVNYVWQKFKQMYFDENTIETIDLINDVLTASKHKPFNSESDEFKKFKLTYFNKCNNIILKNKNVNLDNELIYFST